MAKSQNGTGFGARLRELRESAGMSQVALGEAIGVAYQSIARLERSANEPNWETVLALANALNCKPNDFLPKEDQ